MAQKCKVCLKLFASPDYLSSHYKRRHVDFYTREIRPLEDAKFKREMGELNTEMADKDKVFDKDEFI